MRKTLQIVSDWASLFLIKSFTLDDKQRNWYILENIYLIFFWVNAMALCTLLVWIRMAQERICTLQLHHCRVLFLYRAPKSTTAWYNFCTRQSGAVYNFCTRQLGAHTHFPRKWYKRRILLQCTFEPVIDEVVQTKSAKKARNRKSLLLGYHDHIAQYKNHMTGSKWWSRLSVVQSSCWDSILYKGDPHRIFVLSR